MIFWHVKKSASFLGLETRASWVVGYVLSSITMLSCNVITKIAFTAALDLAAIQKPLSVGNAARLCATYTLKSQGEGRVIGDGMRGRCGAT